MHFVLPCPFWVSLQRILLEGYTLSDDPLMIWLYK